MFDQSHGLRFDIYERIHLPAELPGIAELEEVELIPDIQVIQREDRAELYGQLLLTGLYRGEDDRTQRLEHAIPVEITVPLTRVSSLEDIGVEIENFDIDLLTMRTVNITGVLSLRGVGGAEAQPAWQQEEYTVAYSPDRGEQAVDSPAELREQDHDALYENSLWTYGEGTSAVSADENEPAQAADYFVNPQLTENSLFSQPAALASTERKDNEAKVRTHSLGAETDYALDKSNPWQTGDAVDRESLAGHFLTGKEQSGSASYASGLETEIQLNEADSSQMKEQVNVSGLASETVVDSLPGAETARVHEASAGIHSAYQEEPATYVEPAINTAPLSQENSQQESFPAELTESLISEDAPQVQEEKHDLKIALGSKKEESIQEKQPLTFSSLLSSSRARKEQEDLAAEETLAIAAAPEAGNDNEWKSRFIGGLNGAELFRKVRLCIVQREETIDTIAEKYQLSTRELVLYNRLSEQNVEEGQVLYIP